MTCQAFLTNLHTTPAAKLANADPAKLADKYGLNQCPRCGGRHGGTEWARMHLEARRTRT